MVWVPQESHHKRTSFPHTHELPHPNIFANIFGADHGLSSSPYIISPKSSSSYSSPSTGKRNLMPLVRQVHADMRRVNAHCGADNYYNKSW
eukprot:798076-Amphidinium_carterae.1